MTQIFNKREMKERRRALRRNMTDSETILWNVLRGRRFAGYKFRRQYSIGHYIVDFYSPRIKLVIEIDGPNHETTNAREYDKIREDEIKGLGIHIIRFKNEEVENNLGDVMRRILKKIHELEESMVFRKNLKEGSGNEFTT